MVQENEFDRLEKFVHKLLSQYEQLLDKNAQLQKLLQQRQDEIEELRSQVDSADNERGDISNRIKNLIEEIEEWQSAFAEEGVEQTGVEAELPQQEEGSSEEQNSDEDHGGEDHGEVVEEGREREASQQRNLFQVDSSDGDTFKG